MSVTGPGPKRSGWSPAGSREPVRLVVSSEALVAGDWFGASAGGFPIEVVIAAIGQPLDDATVHGAAALIVEVAEADPASLARFRTIAAGPTPIIAAARDPPLGFVRQLVRGGAHDVVPLPIELAELDSALEAIRRRASRSAAAQPGDQSRLVAVIKSEGGSRRDRLAGPARQPLRRRGSGAAGATPA